MSSPSPRFRAPRALAATALSILIVLALAPLAPAAPPTCSGTPTAASAVSAPPAVTGRAIRCLVNAQRAAYGLRALRPSPLLRVAAERHGADMVTNGFFAHVSPFTGALAARVSRSGYMGHRTDWELGEDLAWGEGDLSTPAAIVEAWMNSPAHRAVILEPSFRDVGVGIVEGVPFATPLAGTTFVMDVGAR
jgi:uncharacterized protein YkwD